MKKIVFYSWQSTKKIVQYTCNKEEYAWEEEKRNVERIQRTAFKRQSWYNCKNRWHGYSNYNSDKTPIKSNKGKTKGKGRTPQVP